MERKMLVLDIDGTLTNSKKEITSKTKEAIIKMARMMSSVGVRYLPMRSAILLGRMARMYDKPKKKSP